MLRRLLLLCGLVLTACQPAPETATSPSLCTPSETTIDESSGYPEIQVSASEGSLWVLLIAQDGIFSAQTKARILWKMTDGRGNINLTAIHEDGTQVNPTWGPISRRTRPNVSGLLSLVIRQMRTDWRKVPSAIPRQDEKAWRHPGQEWGSEFVFPKDGCWRILVSRSLLETDKPITAEIAIEVKP